MKVIECEKIYPDKNGKIDKFISGRAFYDRNQS
jgi:hypothetical protein